MAFGYSFIPRSNNPEPDEPFTPDTNPTLSESYRLEPRFATPSCECAACTTTNASWCDSCGHHIDNHDLREYSPTCTDNCSECNVSIEALTTAALIAQIAAIDAEIALLQAELAQMEG